MLLPSVLITALQGKLLSEPSPAHLQVIFRHGARTPLTTKHWEGTKWDVCRSKTKLPELRVHDHDSGEATPQCIDGDNLVHYSGGCTRGELTSLGQSQVCPDSSRWLFGLKLTL